MTKTELISAVAEKSELKRKDIELAVNSLFEVVTETLSQGEKISIVGFGMFEVRERAARKGHNPRTKEPIDIPASTLPVFKAGKTLKEAVSKN